MQVNPYCILPAQKMHVNLDIFVTFILTEVIIAMLNLAVVCILSCARISSYNSVWLSNHTMSIVWNQRYSNVFICRSLFKEINQIGLSRTIDMLIPIKCSLYNEIPLNNKTDMIFSAIYRMTQRLMHFVKVKYAVAKEVVSHSGINYVYKNVRRKKDCIYVICMLYTCYALTDVCSYYFRPYIVHKEDDIREDSIEHNGAVPTSVFATSCRRSTGRYASTTTSDIYGQPAYYFHRQALLRYAYARRIHTYSTAKMSSLYYKAILQQGSRAIVQLDTVSPLMSPLNYMELTDTCNVRNPFKRVRPAVFTQDGQCLFRHILHCCINIADEGIYFMVSLRVYSFIIVNGCVHTVLIHLTISEMSGSGDNDEMVIITYMHVRAAYNRYRYLKKPTDA